MWNTVIHNVQDDAHNAIATAFAIQIHWSRWVDSPESAGLIGKTSIVGTAMVADVSEG